MDDWVWQGVVSVRAYARETEMHETFLSLIDANHRPFVMFLHLSRWLGIQLDFATILCVTLASILVLVLRHSISPGLAGTIQKSFYKQIGYSDKNFFLSIPNLLLP
jgi:hypothetical protein